MTTRQCHFRLHYPTSETELIPRLQHGTFEMLRDPFILVFDIVEPEYFCICCFGLDDEISLCIGKGVIGRVVMLRIIGIIILF